MRRAAFLDRDGVINFDRAYVYRWQDFEFIPGAVEAMARLCTAGYRLIVVTNQSGISRGYFDEAQFQELTQRMLTALLERGVVVDAVYHCPHHPEGIIAPLAFECDCRKPLPGMILRAASEHGLSLRDSILVGDKPSDIQAARAAGVGRAFVVCADNEALTPEADAAFDNLLHCVDAFLAGVPAV
jgi:D-glycero-D-manno-heptose 1,7-bisphosphate phosphatase